MKVLAWAERLPSTWSAIRLRRVVKLSNSNVDKKSYEDQHAVRLCNYTDVYYNEKIVSRMDFMEATATAREIQRFQLRLGDVILTKDSETWDDIAVAACVAETLENVVCGYHLTLLRTEGRLSGRFLLRAIQAGGVREQFWLAANGVTRFGLGMHGMKQVVLPVPPTSAQQAIADFLDRKTAAIDALIAKKERLIELLQEKRQALITQAVTKGLDPSVPMKDSGIEWLGQIPAHWDALSLRRVASVGQGDAFAHAIQGKRAGEFPWFKVADMNRVGNEREMLTADNYVDGEVVASARARVFPVGTVIFPRVGAALLTNKRRVITQPSVIDDNIYGLIPSAKNDSGFLYLAMLTVDMAWLCSPGLVPTVNFSAIKELKAALPPPDEQVRIAQAVEVETQKLAKLSDSMKRSVVLLQEYRQALITEAVTGKLDIPVPEAA